MEYILVDIRTKRLLSAGCQNFGSKLDQYLFEQLQESVGREVHWDKLPDELREPEGEPK
jgi:hypothetical protein